MAHIHYGILFRLRNKETLSFDSKRLNMEGLMLSKVNQTIRDRHSVSLLNIYCMSSLYSRNKRSKDMIAGKISVGTRVCKGGECMVKDW